MKSIWSGRFGDRRLACNVSRLSHTLPNRPDTSGIASPKQMVWQLRYRWYCKPDTSDNASPAHATPQVSIQVALEDRCKWCCRSGTIDIACPMRAVSQARCKLYCKSGTNGIASPTHAVLQVRGGWYCRPDSIGIASPLQVGRVRRANASSNCKTNARLQLVPRRFT